MKTISSAEFRKTYPRLDDPTSVTVNGHVIGTWVPGSDPQVRTGEVGDDYVRNRQTTEVKAKRITQAERDAILRKVNKESGS